MNILVWNHGSTPNNVRRLMVDRLLAAGISDKVAWNGDQFKSSIGWGTILNLVGRIEPDVIVLEKCSGAIGGVVLAKCREAFQEMFPAGYEVQYSLQPTGRSSTR